MIFLSPKAVRVNSREDRRRAIALFSSRLYGFELARPFDLIPALRIRERTGRLIAIDPNSTQVLFEKHRSPRNIILKARQTGMTTYIAARFFIETLYRPGRVTLQVAHSLESAQQIFRMVHRFFDNLPESKQKSMKVVRSTVRELAFAANDSRYIVDTAGNQNAGRGLTIHNLHASEVALWPHQPQETMAALLAAIPPQGSVEMESTANGADGYFYQQWQRAKMGEGFTPHFFPWWKEATYQAPLEAGEKLEPFTNEEADLLARCGLRVEQIKYRRQMRAQFAALAAQEFAENDAECFLLAGRPVFAVERIEERLRNLPTPARIERNSEELIWLEAQAGRSYVLGADVAEGVGGGDASAAVLLDAASGLQCAEICTRRGVHEFAAALDRLGRTYNTALLAIERNNHGHAVLEALQHSFAYPRIFAHQAGRPGWLTTAQSKPQAIAALDRMLRDAPHAFASRRLLEQCRAYRLLDGGGTGAPPGAYDDLVMAAAIACAVRESARPVELFALQR